MADGPKATFTVLQTAAHLRVEAGLRLESRLQALPRGGEEVTCRPGCHACCYHLVVVSPLEALAIADYVAARPDLRENVEARLGEWQERIDALPGLADGLARFEAAEGRLRDAEGAALEEGYWAAQVPCPFLEEGLCSVYPVRPFACREHLVTSDPALCAEGLDAPTAAAGVRLEFRAVAAAVGERCHGLPDRSVLLPRALEFAAACEEPLPQCEESEARAGAEDAQRRVRMALARLLLSRREPR